jgi:RNase adapter protein RapZ
MQIYIITGYSGAGKSVAMKACEDVGVACMDNIPISAIPTVIASVDKFKLDKIALCCDVRCLGFDAKILIEQIAQLQQNYKCEIIFLQSRLDVLIGRYNATKHRHPLYSPDEQSIVGNLMQEKAMLADLLLNADLVIDTSNYTPHLLKRQMQRIIGVSDDVMAINVMSFSYQMGVPSNADLVFDVRFLRNPHYEQKLQPQTGRDKAVAEYIQQDPNFSPFFEQLYQMINQLIPLYMEEGKSYLTIAFGCTGGKHRSVFTTELLSERLKANYGLVEVQHRELKL